MTPAEQLDEDEDFMYTRAKFAALGEPVPLEIALMDYLDDCKARGIKPDVMEWQEHYLKMFEVKNGSEKDDYLKRLVDQGRSEKT